MLTVTLDSWLILQKYNKDRLWAHFPFITYPFHALLPVRGLSRAVCELPSHQPLVALQCKLGSHQETSIEVREAEYIEQRGHRQQGCTPLLGTQLRLEFKDMRRTKQWKTRMKGDLKEGWRDEWRKRTEIGRSHFKGMLISSRMATNSIWLH